MMTLIWYPKCSTCQKAKKKLEALGADFVTRDIVSPDADRSRAASMDDARQAGAQAAV